MQGVERYTLAPVDFEGTVGYCIDSMTCQERTEYTEKPFNIVLVEPEIPPNTGNIARLCAATGSVLHLVGQLGFSIDDRYLKRAGLDYWGFVTLLQWPDLAALQASVPEGRFFYLSTKVARSYLEVVFQPGDYLVFGKETRGLPEELLRANPDTTITIPMPAGKVRSLNLSSSAAIVLYEALRQNAMV